MVNSEKWKKFIKGLELMGEAKSAINRNLGQGYNYEAVEREIVDIYSGDRQAAAMLIRSAKLFDIYWQAIDGEWQRRTGSSGTVGDKIEGDIAAKFYEDVVGMTPKGGVMLERTDITIHMSLSGEEDFKNLVNKDLKTGKTLPQSTLGRLGGIKLGITTKEGKKGMLTAQKRMLGEKRNVPIHEREHLVQEIFTRCNLINWGREKTSNSNRHYAQLAVEATGAADPNELLAAVNLTVNAGQAGSGLYDEIMVGERAAIISEGLSLDSESLITYLSRDYGCGFVEMGFEKYLNVLKQNGRLEAWQASEHRGKADELMATLIEDNLERLKKGAGVEDNLVRIYGDRNKVRGMLEFVPLRYWPVVERMLMKYGSEYR